jgi:rSAM/selenodomain-associated transferase 2
MAPRVALIDRFQQRQELTLSIIVPCLDEAAVIVAALERLQPLRRRGTEVIVVDGGSSDDSAKLAAPLADRVMIAPRGRASQMNAGATVSQGAVLLFLHADCLLPADADRLIRDSLKSSGKTWGRFDVELIGAHPLFRVIGCMMNWRSRITGMATGDQGLFVTRELFTAIGGFPSLPLMEDLALSKRLRKHCAPLCLRRRIVVSARRWERHGVLRTILLMWRLRLAYFLGADPARLALRYARGRR